MSTTPNPTVDFLPHWVHNYAVFIKAHEKLAMILVTGLLAFHFYNKGITAWENYDARHATAANQTVKVDDSANAALLKDLAAQKLQLQVLSSKMDKAIAELKAETDHQVEVDQTLPLPQLAGRWASLVPVEPAEIVAGPSTITVSENAARATVEKLELIPLDDKTIAGLKIELDAEKGIVVQQDTVIVGLQKQIVDEKAAHVADVKLEKVKTKKALIRGIKIGFIGGVAVTTAAVVLILK